MFPDQIDYSDSVDFTQWLEALRQRLHPSYRDIDVHLIAESIADAVLHYPKHPEKFDPSRKVPLLCYLVMRTRHYLEKKLRKAICRRKHERTVGISDKNFEKIVSGLCMRRGIYQEGTETSKKTSRAKKKQRGERKS